MTKIDISDVSLTYGQGSGARSIFTEINLSIRSGEFVSIIGPSGCGKTSLLRVIGGLVTASSGTVTCGDRRVSRPSRDCAVVFQDYGKALLPWRKVWENVALAFEVSGDTENLRQRSTELLTLMHLEKVVDNYPTELSGGMQQRVQIARTLAQNPKVWLMDEPFGALDAMTRQVLQDEVARIANERAITVVFITHDLEEAIYLGDRVVALGANPGRVVEDIVIDLPRPRSQLETREHKVFLENRARLFHLLQGH